MRTTAGASRLRRMRRRSAEQPEASPIRGYMRVLAILPAAGRGVRMGARETPKVLLPIDGTPMLHRTLVALAESGCVERAVVAVDPSGGEAVVESLAAFRGLSLSTVAGGRERADSVRNAFEALHAADDDLILIHDADRPFAEPEIIREVCAKAEATGAAICAIPVTDTLKESDLSGRILRTQPRERYHLAQTPQVFRADLLAAAYARTAGESVSDEAMLLEKAGVPVHLCRGSIRNIKITRPEDLALAELLARDAGGRA